VTRRLIALAFVLLLPASAALAADRTVDVPRKLRSQIADARSGSGVRVLVPSRITAPQRVFADRARVRDGRYSLSLGLAPGCNTATACFFAAFLADSGKRPSGPREVSLARGRTGRYTPSRCGASCSAPQVQWRERGVRYTIQAKLERRADVVALANQAIRAGAR
jgi:hypothetical protein